LSLLRYAFTVMANITVYGLAWLLLNFQVDQPDRTEHLGIQDVPVFRNLSLIVMGLGAVFSLIFHLGTKEKPYPPGSLPQLEESAPLLQKEPTRCPRPLLTWRDWLLEPAFYQVAVLYMSTRLIVNLSQTYIAMYLTNSLLLPKKYIATIPLVMYISGFLSSFLMKPVNKWIGRNVSPGGPVSLSYAAQSHDAREGQREGLAEPPWAGVGVCSASRSSVLPDTEGVGPLPAAPGHLGGTGLGSGPGDQATSLPSPCRTELCCAACVGFYHWVMVLVTGGVAVAAIVSLCCIMVWPIHIRYHAVCLQGLSGAGATYGGTESVEGRSHGGTIN
ncbi:MFS12 protein, partial [Corythaeola cristata]|nr:MFS12 protein [Corythaeola cristata]